VPWRAGDSSLLTPSQLEARLGPLPLSGTRAARPAAAATNAGTFYLSTDTGHLSWSNGSTWKAVSPAMHYPGYLLPDAIRSWGGAAGSQAATQNSLRGARFTAPSDGTVGHVYGVLGTLSGNAIAAIYDDTVTTRQRLWLGASTPLASVIQDLGNANLAVTDGQAFDASFIIDNATATQFRAALSPNEITVPSPLGRGIPDGGGSCFLGWAISPGSFTVPGTLTEASLSLSGTVPLILVQFTPA
jgi:hypothetical protein